MMKKTDIRTAIVAFLMTFGLAGGVAVALAPQASTGLSGGAAKAIGIGIVILCLIAAKAILPPRSADNP